MAEAQFRRGLQVSLSDWLVFFKHPSSATLMALSLLALLAPLIFKGLRRYKGDDAQPRRCVSRTMCDAGSSACAGRAAAPPP